MDRVGIEFLSVMNLSPVALVNLAADLGCQYISTMLGSLATSLNPLGYPSFSLVDDKNLRREMIAVMKGRGVSISLGEGYVVQPGADLRDRAADMEVMHELGVRRINAVSMDPDVARTFDQFAMVAEMADNAGMETTLEFAPELTVGDLPTALAAIRHVGRKDCRLLIDTMHLMRSGSSPAEVAALDPAIIGYVQLSDVPRKSTYASYMEEAMFERLPPGEGELPLKEILDALPRHLVIGLEVPQLAEAQRGVSPHDRLRNCVDGTRRLLDSLPTKSSSITGTR
jgi:sugar phosphate isomerase/epimerase